MYLYIIVFMLSHSKSFWWWIGSFCEMFHCGAFPFSVSTVHQWDWSFLQAGCSRPYCWLYETVAGQFLFPVLWHVCIRSDLNTKTVLTVYADFSVDFSKPATSTTLICVLDWIVFYSVFCELLKGKKTNPEKYWILVSHIPCERKKCVFTKSDVKQI